MQPSVNRLVELVGVLGAPVSAIFDELEVYERPVGSDAPDVAEPLPGVFVSTAGDIAVAHLGQGVTYRRLTPTALPGIELFESSYPPGTSSSVDGAMLVHAGYECGDASAPRRERNRRSRRRRVVDASRRSARAGRVSHAGAVM